MTVLKRDKQVNFKTDKKIWEEASEVFKQKNIDATTGFNLFLEFVASRKELPFLTEDEVERERLIAGLKNRVKKNILEIQAGQSMNLDEMEHRLNEV